MEGALHALTLTGPDGRAASDVVLVSDGGVEVWVVCTEMCSPSLLDVNVSNSCIINDSDGMLEDTT